MARRLGGTLVLTVCAVVALAAWTPGGATAAESAGDKWIDVNLAEQWLTAYEGPWIIWSGPISSGRGEYATPTGTFAVQRKAWAEDMRGEWGTDEYYYRPEVPWVLYFTPRGHAIHGVYWHSRFGTPSSHGCVGAPLRGAAILYEWAPVGTPIVIHD